MIRKAYSCGTAGLLFCATILFTATLFPPVVSARSAALSDQASFASPQQAVDALIAAVQNDSDSDLLAVLGPDSEALIASGDPVADQIGRSRFLKAIRENINIEPEKDDRVVFLVGEKNYPFPIPIIRQDKRWLFDTQAGKEEILNRRIGENELNTIEVVQAYTDAQREYACMEFNGDGPTFAQKFASTPGEKDGLYWDSVKGEEESPFGPLIADATEMGYSGGLDADPPEPFQGYYFKILTGQGEHATGGAFDYVVNGKMVLGFALVAYPARYGASGIMTFIVNQEGVVYEKDLGDTTAEIVAAMSRFDPDSSWNRYREPGEQESF